MRKEEEKTKTKITVIWLCQVQVSQNHFLSLVFKSATLGKKRDD
jgi:hypothetical protein